MQPRACWAGLTDGLRLVLILCCWGCLSLSLSPTEPLARLPAPQNLRIHLYNLEQVLRWDPVPISNLTGPVLYSVEYKFLKNSWSSMTCVNCTRIAESICNFTAYDSSCFPHYFNISLRVKAQLGELVSDWALAPWFQHFRNATIGPPLDVVVTSHDGSLIINFKPPFKVEPDKFDYIVHYWEKEGEKKIKGPFPSQSIELNNLKVPNEYCLQVQAKLNPSHLNDPLFGQLSNTSCFEISSQASAKFQQVMVTILGISVLIFLVLGCYVLAQKSQSLIKSYFHSPPGIPPQIKEFLMEPNEPILEALDNNSSVAEDCCASLSIVSCQEDNQDDLSNNLSDNT
ncbi:interferon gamma receptor 2 isoform X1 [Antechinus flavipes]|uniref:interferon gamma receptor 2 isoform X1 n=1 Tax=Antechinus flavipes TaxID=38775 RepID=UPI002235D2D4|nr:interferon gamma receptor 2 isoform X1 [Antechinus flavipes]